MLGSFFDVFVQLGKRFFFLGVVWFVNDYNSLKTGKKKKNNKVYVK